MKLACSHLSCNHEFDFLRRDARVETRVDLGNQRVDPGRRSFLASSLAAGAGAAGLAVIGGCASLAGPSGPADTMIVNGRIATLNRKQPTVSAVAIKDGKILAVGSDADLQHLRGPNTTVIDAGGRTVVPGLNDAHTHFIRGGLTYTNEVRWDGVPSLAEGMRRVREQARRTPSPHWVQVIGGWTWAQFAEKRFPTLDEINAATGDTPCMVMHLYDRAWLNRAAIRVLGWDEGDAEHVRRRDRARRRRQPDRPGRGRPRASPAWSAVWLRVPRLSPEDQIDLDAPLHARAQPPRHHQRDRRRRRRAELPRQLRGDRASSPRDNQLTLRIGYSLFAQAPGKELENYTAWSKLVKIGQGNDYYRMIGAGEYISVRGGRLGQLRQGLIRSPPPGVMETKFTAVVKYLAGQGWPFRQHTSFDATGERACSTCSSR